MRDKMKLEFSAKSVNEAFARVTVAAFVSKLDPTLEELSEIKTALSEAVTNSVIHGYRGLEGMIYIECEIEGRLVEITVCDKGVGIDDVEKAREPLFTTNTDGERSGMGFTVMETFMDSVEVNSVSNVGTKVIMRKLLSDREGVSGE